MIEYPESTTPAGSRGAEHASDETMPLETWIDRDIERAHDIAARQNHDSAPQRRAATRAPLSSIVAPTLVIHGTADPMFPLGHGEALVEEIPRATLLPVAGAGHGLDPRDWSSIVPAGSQRTARG